ncbi:MAG: cobyrinate a,c-diamide synthase [Cyanobacteria bacterium P01_G01_bin.38]
MGLIIAGERSGVGKTTVTLALLAALASRSSEIQPAKIQPVKIQPVKIQSFKVGPDYIDPMFHRAITGRACHNLDPVLTSEAYVVECYRRAAQGVDYALVEGVMGLFDGASGDKDLASTAHIARLLDLPVVLVVDCARLSRSVAALVQGYCAFDPRVGVVGVVLNRVGSDRHLSLLKAALATIEMPVVGVLRRDAVMPLPDRHLGLVPIGELGNFGAIAEQLAEVGRGCFDWARLEEWVQGDGLRLRSVERGDGETRGRGDISVGQASRLPGLVRIAIASDPAFNFYYAENLAQLEAEGAQLVYWSPLQDELPEVEGLYLGGGFPEMFAAALAANQRARSQVKQAIMAGMPTYAECGGLMYLCEKLTDFQGQAWPMVGVLPTAVEMTGKLSLGYRRAMALSDTPLLAAGQQVIGHEFHRSALSGDLPQPIYRAQRYSAPTGEKPEGWQIANLHASYIHLHWGGQPEMAQRFVTQCRWYLNFKIIPPQSLAMPPPPSDTDR